VPDHLRPASTRLAREMGWGRGYRYAHDFVGGMTGQSNLPDAVADGAWLRPGGAGFEKEIARYLDEFEEFRRNGRPERKDGGTIE
jgi:putative ATPase